MNQFTDTRVIKRPIDIFIGGVVLYDEEISLDEYQSRVNDRIYRLLNKAVDELYIENGGDRDEAHKSVLSAIQDYLYDRGGYIPYDDSIEGMVDAITQSPQFDKWHFTIRDRFYDIHKGVIQNNTKFKPEEGCIVELEIVEDVRTGDELLYLLDGLGNYY